MTTLEKAARVTLLQRAEQLWKELQDNELGGFSGINRPFWIAQAFKEIESAAFSAALLDPSGEVVEAVSIVLAGTDQDGWDRLCCESPSLAKRITDKSRNVLRAAGVKITGSQG